MPVALDSLDILLTERVGPPLVCPRHPDVPASGYATLTLDPPWLESGGGAIRRGANRHYGVLKTRDILQVIVDSGRWAPAEHAHVYLWVTNNYLEDGLWLLRRLGVRYVTTLVWIKLARLSRADLLARLGRWATGPDPLEAIVRLHSGLGQYFRGAHELCLFGVVGTGTAPAVYTGRRDLPTVICAPKRAHSVKPDAAYRRIEARSKGPYVEFFARAPRAGWTSWGNEVNGT